MAAWEKHMQIKNNSSNPNQDAMSGMTDEERVRYERKMGKAQHKNQAEIDRVMAFRAMLESNPEAAREARERMMVSVYTK